MQTIKTYFKGRPFIMRFSGPIGIGDLPILLVCTLQIGYRVLACSPYHRLRSLHACQSFGNGFICAMKIEPGKFP
jgi:hypothetical protein